MSTTPPPERSTQAAVALLKQLQLVVNSSTFTDFHSIVAENEKLMSENQRFKVTQEENCVLLTQKQNELESRRGDMVRHHAELEAASKETESVRKELEASRESVRQELAESKKKVTALETERQSTSSKVTELMTTIKKWEEEARQWREKAAGHEKLKSKADATALKVEEELKATKKDLSSASSRLEKLEKYSYPFQEAKWERM